MKFHFCIALFLVNIKHCEKIWFYVIQKIQYRKKALFNFENLRILIRKCTIYSASSHLDTFTTSAERILLTNPFILLSNLCNYLRSVFFVTSCCIQRFFFNDLRKVNF